MSETRIISPDTERENRVPPGQHVVQSWPVLHYGPVPRIDPSDWTFEITGLVEQPRTLTWNEFAALPRVHVFSDIHCVTTWSRLNNWWEGVSTAVLRDLVAIRPEARFALVHGAAGFTTNLPIDDLFQPDVLFALKHDNQDLSAEHGAPMRLVVPRLYFWKSAKWVTGIEFLQYDHPGFWEAAGYHMRGDPWKEERYGR